MPRSYPIKNNFTSGAITPLLHARPETKGYNNGLKTCRNFAIYPHGGLGKCAGFTRVADTLDVDNHANYSAVALVPFSFASNYRQSYMLEFGHHYIRFYQGSDHSRIDSTPGTAYEVATTYTAAQVQDIRWAQSNDVLYLVHRDHPPRKLTRYGLTDWRLEESAFIGDFTDPLPGKLEYRIYTWEKSLTEHNQAGSTSRLNVYFQSPATKIGSGLHNEATYGLAVAYKSSVYPIPAYINEAGSKVIRDNSSQPIGLIYSGKIYAPDSAYYSFGLNLTGSGDLFVDDDDVLVENYDTLSTQYASAPGARDEFAFNSVKFLSQGNRFFEARCVKFYDPQGVALGVGWRKNLAQTDLLFTGSGLNDLTLPYFNSGSNDSTKDWYGNRCFEIRVWIVPNNTANFGWAYREETALGTFTAWVAIAGNINSVGVPQNGGGIALTDATSDYGLGDESGTSPNGAFHGGGLLSTMKFSAASGHTAGDYWGWKVGYLYAKPADFQRVEDVENDLNPSSVTLHKNRLTYGGADDAPNRFWMSRPGDYDNFTQGSDPDDGLQFDLGADNIDPIQWLLSAEDLFVGTVSSECVLSTGGDPITPDTPPPPRKSGTGSAFVQAVLTGREILFVDSSQKKLYQYSYFDDKNSFVPVDISVAYEHLIQDGIKQMAFQKSGRVVAEEPINFDVLWMVTEEGGLIGCTFETQHDVTAWFERVVKDKVNTTEYTGVFESIGVIPGANGHELWAAISFTVGATHHRTIAWLNWEESMDLGVTIPLCEAETLPFEVIYESGSTSRGMKKRFEELYVTVQNAAELTVAKSSYPTRTQEIATAGSDPIDVRIPMLGSERTPTLIFKHQQAGPCTILAVHGRMMVNAV